MKMSGSSPAPVASLNASGAASAAVAGHRGTVWGTAAIAIPGSIWAGLLFGRQSQVVAGAQVGAQLKSPGIVKKWGRDDILRNASSNALSALAARIQNPAMGVPEPMARAFEALVSGRDHETVKPAEPMLRAWLQYLDHISDPGEKRLIHINTYEVPGIDAIQGADGYALRGLGLPASASDVTVLPDDIPTHVIQRHAALRKLVGLPVGQTMRLSDYLENRDALHDEYVLQEFYRTERSPNPKMYEMQEKFENKNYCMQFLAASGIPTPNLLYTGLARSLDPDHMPQIPAVFKLVRSAGGAGVSLVQDRDQLRRALAATDVSAEVQLQQMVPGIDCSKQYFVGDHGPAPITNTDQIIKDGVSHVGNEVLSTAMDIADNHNSDRAATALWAVGYRGYLAVDLMKPEDGGPAQVIELNLRKGGVTVPAAVATQLGVSEFVARQVLLPCESAFSTMQERFALRPGHDIGTVAYSVIPLDRGQLKAEVVCIDATGGRDVAAALEEFQQGIDGLVSA